MNDLETLTSSAGSFNQKWQHCNQNKNRNRTDFNRGVLPTTSISLLIIYFCGIQKSQLGIHSNVFNLTILDNVIDSTEKKRKRKISHTKFFCMGGCACVRVCVGITCHLKCPLKQFNTVILPTTTKH